jgi:hypothetical protein
MTKFVGNNITLPKLSAAPPSPVSGDTYYDTTLNKPFTYNGTEWVDLGASGHTHTSFANNLQINKADSKVQLLNTTSGSGTEDGMYLLMADTNVGYLWNAETNGALVFGTGGAEQARITPAGKFGIGTNAPAHQLEVVGPASVTVGLSAGGSGFAELELVGQAGKNYITSDDTLSFDIGGTERATVATTGLDVTSGTLSQGGTAVSLSGHTHSTSNITSGNFAATVSGGTGVTVTGGTGNASTPSIAIGQAVATSSSPTFAEVTTTGAIRTATGNADPAVYVGDDALIFDADTADSLGIQGQQTAANGAIVFGSGKDTNIYRGGADILKTDDAFTAGGNITSSGYLGANGRIYYNTAANGIYSGLGGTNGRLVQTVNPTANVGADFAASTSSTTSGIILTKSLTGQPTTNIGGSGTTDAFADAVRNGGMTLDNSNQRFYVYSTGAWRYASLTNPSDSRLKKEITEISGAIDKLRQLIPVSFKWKAPHLHERSDAVADDGSRIGFIAEQVATTDLKHWVETMNISGEEAEIATGNADETEILAVNIPQNEIEALLVQALLDIDTRLKAIEEKL